MGDWENAQATIQEVVDISFSGAKVSLTAHRVAYTYTDANGEHHAGEAIADSWASMFRMRVGDRFDLTYDPRRPQRHNAWAALSVFDEIKYVCWTLAMIAFPIVLIGGLLWIGIRQSPVR